MKKIRTVFIIMVLLTSVLGCTESIDNGDCINGGICNSGLTLVKEGDWTVVPSEELKACTEEEQCATVEMTCSDCCKPNAVNEKKKADYWNGKEELCADWSGEVCNCEFPLGTPKCVNGQCKYVLGKASDVCGNLSFDPGYADECEAKICVSGSPVSVTNYDDNKGFKCVGPGGSDTCAASTGEFQQYSFENDDLYIHLTFTSEIVGNYSTEQFRKTFNSGTATAKFNIDGKTAADSFNLDSFEGEYKDGKIIFNINHTIDYLYYNLESDNDDCLTDDILGICACYYDMSFNMVYNVALEIQSNPSSK